MTDFLTSPLGFGADDSPRSSYTLRVNGVERPVADAWIGESLLYVLRERLGLAGAKGGCEQGECGACSVQVDGQLTAACLVPAALAAGVEIRTVEGLADEGVPSDVQQALADSGAVQCGYCAPGLAMAVHDLLERNHHPSELEARQALCGNLCRCTGYRGVLAAVQAVAAARADEEESSDEESTGSPYFGDGPFDSLIEATSPVEELVPLPVPAQAEHVDPYGYDPADAGGRPEHAEDDGYEDDGYDVDAELPVYVDVPPQHGGYDGGYGDGGYPAPGYGTQDPGYPQQESYPQQGYATGTYGRPYEQPYGEGPYPGGPFGGRFPSQSDGPGSRSAAGEAVGTLLMTAPGGTQELPVVDPASHAPAPPRSGPATGEFHLAADSATGEFATGEFHTGEIPPGGLRTGEFHISELHGRELHGDEYHTGEFAVGEFRTGAFPVGDRASTGNHLGGDHAGATVPEQPGAAVASGRAAGAGQTGEMRLGAGLGAGMRAQAAARRRTGGARRTTAGQDEAAASAPATGVPGLAAGGGFGGAAGLPSDVTGSFHVGTISVPVVDPSAADDAAAGDHPYDYDRASGVPGGLDPTTGVYVLPHQHGQETGS